MTNAVRDNTDAYRVAVHADSPNLYFRCKETSGDLTDDANAQTGTANGGITYGVTSTLGSSDTAVTLNGTTGYFTVPDGTYTDLGDVFTLECWVKTTDYTHTQTLFGKDTNAYSMRVDTVSSHVFLTINKIGFGGICVATAQLPEDGAWHHLVATKNGSTVHLYQDGVDVSGAVTNATCSNSSTALNIGREASGSRFFNGSLDELAVYPTALSAARVAAHYAAGTASTFAPLAANSLSMSALAGTTGGLYPSASTYPSSTTYLGGWTLVAATTNSLTLTAA